MWIDISNKGRLIKFLLLIIKRALSHPGAENTNKNTPQAIGRFNGHWALHLILIYSKEK
jgi:hypothetical protein